MEHDVALVTGGSGAFGGAVARVLDARGYRVAVHYATGEKRAREVQAELSHPSMTVGADVTDRAAVGAMVAEVRARLGEVSVLVNAAGVRQDGLLATQPPEEWTTVVAVNLLGTFHTCRAVLPRMLTGRWGRIVNVVSLAGMIGSAGQTAYSASKAGVIGLTRSLAVECGRRGVTVNAISPGFMPTDMTQDVPHELRTAFLARTPLGRFGTPDEIARGIETFLDSDFLTGQVLPVDGGISVS
ncbi:MULTISPECIES: 3-oxoacyl-ACP reductase FabG [unclassified Streptomyces]|uniref:3-oxoacyl-ACP reductase FabG n=1 Tax=unclassified Streptomyces TaxID=2593676 RepID=UPI0036ED328F